MMRPTDGPGGRRAARVTKTSASARLAAIEELRKRYAGREIVVVSHGGVMLSVWAHIAGAWHGAHLPPNCGIVLVEHDPQQLYPPLIVEGLAEGELG